MSHTLHYKVSIIGALISSIAFTAFAVFAIAPGETLDPVNTHGADGAECPNGPTDVTCIVNPYEGLDPGSILFLDSAGDLNTSPDLFWDDVNGRIGIGTVTPAAKLDISTNSTTPARIILSTAVGSYFLNTFGGGATNKFSIGRINPSSDDFVLVDGNVGIGATPTANLQVNQKSVGEGTVSTPGNSTTLTGVGTQFRNTFKVGDTIAVAGETVRTISTITSDTVLDTTVAFSATPRSAVTYTLTGGNRFSVLGNGNVGIGTSTPASALEVISPNYPVIKAIRSTVLTTTPKSSLASMHMTTADMVDGFGSDVSFMIQDNSGIAYEIANIGAVREGVDQNGAIFFSTRPGNIRTERMRITNAGNVGIGETSPTSLFTVGLGGLFQVNASGDMIKIKNIDYSWPSAQALGVDYVLANNGAGGLSWADPALIASDENLKTNIQDINESVLSQLNDVRTITYIAENDPGQRTQIGFLTQDLERYFPELVGERNDGYKGVYYAQMTPILTKAIKELDLKINILEQQTISSGGFSLITLKSVIRDVLSDVGNGIQNIFAKRVTTEELCVEDICVTRDQFLRMVENSNQNGNNTGEQTEEEYTELENVLEEGGDNQNQEEYVVDEESDFENISEEENQEEEIHFEPNNTDGMDVENATDEIVEENNSEDSG